MDKYRKYADDSEDDFDLEDDLVDVLDEESKASDETEFNQEDEEVSDELEALLEEESSSYGSGQRFKVPVWVFILAGVVLLAAIAFAAVIRYRDNKPNDAQVNLYEYLGIGQGEIVVYLDGERVETEALLMDGEYYIDNAFLREYITTKFYYDSSLDRVLYTTATDIYHIPLNQDVYYLDEAETQEVKAMHTIAMQLDNQLYLSLQFLTPFLSGYCYRIDSAPERIRFYKGDQSWSCIQWNSEQKNITVRVANSIKAAIVSTWAIEDTEVLQEEGAEPACGWWYVVSSDDGSGWLYVESVDGRSGYVKAEEVSAEDYYKVSLEAAEIPIYPNQLRDYEILLGWQGVYDRGDNTHIAEYIDNAPQMNVVSPTWYKVSDNAGNVDSFYVDEEYVKIAHQKGLEVWALISDFNFPYTEGMDEETFLKDAAARAHLIEVMMQEAATYQYDGWNIDFEHIPEHCGYDYIQFIRELSIACRANELVLSVDCYVPRPFRKQYREADQAECIDYLIFMGYDEHWAGCDEAGSTSSLGFVVDAMDRMVELAPREKLVMGVPFYTRLWEETTDADGNKKLTSTAYTMAGSKKVVEDLGLDMVWDDDVNQYVAKGVVNDVKYSIWIEDKQSMRIRVTAIREYKIAGLAAWSLGFEEPGTWSILAKNE